MLLAKNEQGQLILAHKESVNQRYFCPVCHEEVILRQGTRNIAHFSHKKLSACSNGGESLEHEYGKWLLYQWCQESSIHSQLEAYIANINQRADILLTVGDRQVALEFQCSPLSNTCLYNRTSGYCRSHIDVIWLVGQQNFKKRSWQFYYNKGCIGLDVNKKTLLLKTASSTKYIKDIQQLLQLSLHQSDKLSKNSYRFSQTVRLRRYTQLFLYYHKTAIQSIPSICYCWPKRYIGIKLPFYELLICVYSYCKNYKDFSRKAVITVIMQLIKDISVVDYMPLINKQSWEEQLIQDVVFCMTEIINACRQS